MASKTLGELITDVRDIIGQRTPSKSQFTNSKITGYLNDAVGIVIFRTQKIPLTSRDYTPTSQTVALNVNTVYIKSARWSVPLPVSTPR